MRTAFIAPQPFTDIRATPMQNLRLTRILADAGYSVDVITYPFGSAPEYPGVTVHRCPRLPMIRRVGIGFSAAKLLMDVSLAAYALRLSRKMEFDIIHGVEEGVFVGILMGRRSGTPVIYDMDSIMSHDASSGMVGRVPLAVSGLRAAERWAIRHSELVMTISSHMAGFARSIDPEKKVAVIPDVPLPLPSGGVDTESVRSAIPTSIGEHQKIVLYTGSLAGYQGMELLISAMRQVIDREPSALLVVVGGDEREIKKFRSIAQTSGMIQKLLFLGKRPPEEIPHFLGLADVLVSPRRGGVNPPAKVYTYMQSGRPLVATNVPAHSAVLGEESAILTEPSSDGIAEGILWALAHPKEAEHRAIRAREAVRELTPESQARQVLEAYRLVMDKSQIQRSIAA